MNHFSYNVYHLGDSFVHLHFLRHLALKHPNDVFVHATQQGHLVQLAEAIEDVPNVKLMCLEDAAKNPGNHWMDAWKAAGRTNERPGFWDIHPKKYDWSGFYLDWFAHVARGMGMETPFHEVKDLWFDYPKIKNGYNMAPFLQKHGFVRAGTDLPEFDFLVVNSPPLSAQFRAFNDVEYLTPLIQELAAKHRVIVTNPIKRVAPGGGPPAPTIPCTLEHRFTITAIGALSLYCPYLLMVSTGPSWPTFNVWNMESVKLRLILQDTEQLNLGGNMLQANSREAARSVLAANGLL